MSNDECPYVINMCAVPVCQFTCDLCEVSIKFLCQRKKLHESFAICALSDDIDIRSHNNIKR